ncbi:MAG: pyruvate:ferredoxin (flavodoxin) oxidoreductase [Polyangiaceae bacterium]|nr:pyruvate:ferredoxin (flavodoxin) oxidoreductase [Polyangiaceae bacterium]MCE7888203.1 pyruvate:ferredoxin (flavodoxin) oxidoreductase [Sorangiineae bacterium PRO1]MCL4749859.1 pyruvate:ferredoxin (flavodoxin) oxidoreductase [Myxococcales bacterium]
MSSAKHIAVDGNEAVASVAYRASEVIAIYPITPASAMGELADAWAAHGDKNLWGRVPSVMEMQSEGGAAGAVHGALQAGSLATTFTSSQGLLLMIPNMFKIAGELTPFVLHVAARTIATHALSIFGDHSDVMACRSTGFAMLCSGSVQEAQDLACIAHVATLRSRLPFLHFFDGFRVSHEIAKIVPVDDAELAELMPEDQISAHRARALTPDRPVLRGTAQNPDTFFQAREAINGFYDACPDVVEETMARFAELTGRRYRLFDYHGHPEAERVVVMMGSGAETAHATVDALVARGERVGVLKVRLFRPFSLRHFLVALPKSVKSIAVLDRTKEPGAPGEPLYLDVVAACRDGERPVPRILGGRYGLSSKEFTPAMVKAVFAELDATSPKRSFSVGIVDDVTKLSLDVDPSFRVPESKTYSAVFWGLGSDGTVGANKSSIKIIAEETDGHAQGYFVYDSKKSGAVTVSHLRFGPNPIRAPYLIEEAELVACHQFELLERYDVLATAKGGSIFLLNAPTTGEALWQSLPREVQATIQDKKLTCYVVDAHGLAREHGLGGRINTVMQAAFFVLSGALPREEALTRIEASIKKSYGARGDELVHRNVLAARTAVDRLVPFTPPATAPSGKPRPAVVPAEAPDFVQRVSAMILAGKGDLLPVSAFPVDGTWPVGTSRFEKRNLAHEIPVWDAGLCIQCNKCALVCPHAAIRAKVYDDSNLAGAPKAFKSTEWKSGELQGHRYTIQVAPEDCTGCSVCVAVCPAKDKSNPRHKAIDMTPQAPLRDQERESYAFFLSLPEPNRKHIKLDVKETQLLEPLFEYSGACSGCGETPYVKLLTQLFGDRLLMANATGCSSIYGGNLPTTPYTTNKDGRGPAWSNSLFEDNAEFGFGFRLSVDYLRDRAQGLVKELESEIGDQLGHALLGADQSNEGGIAAQRDRVRVLRERLQRSATPAARQLSEIADYLVKKSVWIVGGDGWAYDIGFGGLDHVLASDRNVNVLVLDTEVYSNTGGQQSKATPRGASAKFASSGKGTAKKDLGLIAMSYGHVYVARVAFGAKDAQTVRAFVEAEAYPGPSLIIAYSHCIAHGYDLVHGPRQQKLAVESGVWNLFRYDPERTARGEPPLQLDSGAPKGNMLEYARNEARFRMVERANPERFAHLMKEAENDAKRRLVLYGELARFALPTEK